MKWNSYGDVVLTMARIIMIVKSYQQPLMIIAVMTITMTMTFMMMKATMTKGEFACRWSGFQMTVERNHANTSVLILVGFLVGSYNDE